MNCSDSNTDTSAIANGTLTINAAAAEPHTGDWFGLECDIGFEGNETGYMICNSDRNNVFDWSNEPECEGNIQDMLRIVSFV